MRIVFSLKDKKGTGELKRIYRSDEKKSDLFNT